MWLEDNFQFFWVQIGVYVYVDLIVGLFGELVETFVIGFDWLVVLGFQEIQVGIFKWLCGILIVMYDELFEMVYSLNLLYEILMNDWIDFGMMQCMKCFVLVWDWVVNSGNFCWSVLFIWVNGLLFECFVVFVDWFFVDLGWVYGLLLQWLVDWFFMYLIQVIGQEVEIVVLLMFVDYYVGGCMDVLFCLCAHILVCADILWSCYLCAIFWCQMCYLE